MLIAHLEFQLDNSILTQRTLRLRVGAVDVALAWDRIAAGLRDKQQIAGFRKGKAPLAVVRKQLRKRIAAEAFQELKRAALDQVMRQLEDVDKPLLPPEVLEPEKIEHHYNQQLEFVVKYLIDPSGVTKNPAQPDFQQGAVQPGSAVQQLLQHPTTPGIPAPPRLPKT